MCFLFYIKNPSNNVVSTVEQFADDKVSVFIAHFSFRLWIKLKFEKQISMIISMENAI